MFGDQKRCWDRVLRGRITGNGGGVNDTVGNFLFSILSFNFSELLLGLIGMVRNLQGRIVPCILPVTRVI